MKISKKNLKSIENIYFSRLDISSECEREDLKNISVRVSKMLRNNVVSTSLLPDIIFLDSYGDYYNCSRNRVMRQIFDHAGGYPKALAVMQTGEIFFPYLYSGELFLKFYADIGLHMQLFLDSMDRKRPYSFRFDEQVLVDYVHGEVGTFDLWGSVRVVLRAKGFSLHCLSDGSVGKETFEWL